MSRGRGQHDKRNYFDQAPAISDQLFLNCMVQLFRCFDFDLEPITLKLNCDLAVLKMYLHAENEVAT